MLLRAAILCCLATAALAADGHKAKKNDARGKRNLDYSISHHYPSPSYRLERRISTPPQLPRYPPFFPAVGQRPNSHRKGRPQSVPPPPYAVQMEPLVQYSQRDPLYEGKLSALPAVIQNELPKGEDLLGDDTQVPGGVYAGPRQVIERPVYIKEPEPIIEIIIKESNETLPSTLATPTTPAPKNKQDVQVFYVKYKKNPNANGKDSIIYEKPVPAISPEVKHLDEETRSTNYNKPPPEYVTPSPSPTTTLRAIIKPDSGVYHAPKGIRITFGPHKQIHVLNDDVDEESAPQPAVSLPHTEFEGRTPNFPPNFRPQQYRSFGEPPTQYPQFGVKVPSQLQSLPQTRNPEFRPPPQFREAPHIRQPVPYTPFGQVRSENPVYFPRSPPTHFPARQDPSYLHHRQAEQHALRQQFTQQQLPSVQHQQPFNPDFQRPNFPQVPPHYVNQLQTQQIRKQQDAAQLEQIKQQQILAQRQQLLAQQKQQQLNNNQFHGNSHAPPTQQQQLHDQQLLAQQKEQQLNKNQFHGNSHAPSTQQQHQLQGQQFLPPGGQLISSVPKYEQHITVGGEVPALPPQAVQNQQTFRQHDDIKTDKYYHQQQLALQNQRYQIQQQQLQQLQQQQNRNAPDPFYVGTTHPTPVTQTTTTARPPVTTENRLETTTKDAKELSKQLPDEVPDDLREQLLSSGILNHAQISVLDYDKVGDIPLSALPPDQLANFYNAGGGQQIAAGSEPVSSVAEKPLDMIGEGSEIDEVQAPKDQVEMKVVHYDPETEDGKKVRDSYVQDDATKTDPVVLNDDSYNRYLPLKVNGAEFPLPDIPELKGKKIGSVVVLAPVDYNFKEDGGRVTRDVQGKEIKFASGSVLQELIVRPTKENYLRFLENENKTSADKQAVILLVTGNVDAPKEEREIFMFDVATKTVSKLSGDLSSAFVQAAEANSDASTSASNVVEIRVPSPTEDRSDDSEKDLEDSASGIVESAIPPIIDPMEFDLEPEASEQLDRFIDMSGQDLTASDTKNSIESEARFATS